MSPTLLFPILISLFAYFRSRSSNGTTDSRNTSTSSLFAFHPVDHSSTTVSKLEKQAAVDQPFFTPAPTSSLGQRRSVGRLSVDTSAIDLAQVDYMVPYGSSPFPPSFIQTAPLEPIYVPEPVYTSWAGPTTAPMYPSYPAPYPMTPVQEIPINPLATASVMQPAPGNINVAPPMSSGLPTPSTKARAVSNSKQVDVQPILTSAPLALPQRRPEMPTRVIAALPSKRTPSAQKPRKAPAKKAQQSTQASFGSFINFTSKDAAVISAGVAPSGSKNKRKSDDSSSEGNKRSRQSNSP